MHHLDGTLIVFAGVAALTLGRPIIAICIGALGALVILH
jgi:hypothetical protein